jgi:hypothetical protein
MRPLQGLVSFPLVRADGSITERPGYDNATQVYCAFQPEDYGSIPENPTRAELVAALKLCLLPFRDYQFATAVDRGATVGAVLTVVARAGLETAPGIFVDAPVQASGKTKLASALAALHEGKRVGVTAFVAENDKGVEMKKQLVAAAMGGGACFLLDNVKGLFGSSVLASMLTSGRLSERILGVSTQYDGCYRSLFLATGNNASLDHDLSRRFVIIRIDTKEERPHAVMHKFDPIQEALTRRVDVLRGALTLVKGWTAAGKPDLRVHGCDFDQWSALVRCVVLWIKREGFSEEVGFGDLDDPARRIIEDAGADDPEVEGLGLLLRGLMALTKGCVFTASDVLTAYQGGDKLIAEGLGAILPPGRPPTSQTVGYVLKNRRDRIVGGMTLKYGGRASNAATYLVQEIK